ncbi:hypothetical protein [Agriterribacter sp.]|uniref:hypothetical protein n=1 Tax=Agriterribacter sp. TaxID=2821509 RepID=UPI002CD2EFE2|nr:hypothetical protein [Agriterribacter sp.]HTN06457.1 hypothetical protein [Agriterribacter sp.]
MSYIWLWPCIVIALLSIYYTDANAQIQHHAFKDTLPAGKNNVVSEKIASLKNTAGHTKDSLRSFKDSIRSLLKSTFKNSKNNSGQDSLNRLLDSFTDRDSLSSYLAAHLGYDPQSIHKDSLVKKLRSLPAAELKKRVSVLKQALHKPDKDVVAKKLTSLVPAGFDGTSAIAQIGGGYINYNYMFRSAIDTPYMEQNMGQHLVNAQLDVALMGLPFQVSYYGRKSNSVFLRDYNDFRVAFNVPSFRRLKQEQLRRQLNSLTGKIQPPELTQNLKGVKDRIKGLKLQLTSTELLNRYLKAKQNIAYADRLPDSTGDKNTLIESSKNIVSTYEQQQQTLNHLEAARDSLQFVYQGNVKKIQQLRQLVNGNLYTTRGVQQIREELKEEGLLDKKTDRLLKTAYAVRSFAIGRTLPNMSNLTVKNVNVTGINFEYNASNIYAAITAGKIDFRSRDFMYGKPSRVPQRVYAAAIGYGEKEGNHLIITGYSGKKQIISNSGLTASPLSGMSIEGQWRISQYFNVTAEAAQSTSPVHASAQGVTKQQGFKISDNSNKAYSIKLLGYLPSTRTRFEGYYQKTGINFQNFTNYRVNANTSTWSMRIEQYLWKRQLRLLASARKNDYSNPFIIQQYNSNTVFTSFSATLRKRNLPSLTVGYIPSSQYTIVGNQVAESRYQSLNISATHTYRIGIMRANGTVTYNRFYNSGSDTGFVYYNANHFYTWHQFVFSLFTANMGYARTANKQYALDVMDGGLTINYTKNFSTGGGVKINKYNTTEVKTGLYYNFRCRLQRIGDINLWYERGYLPGSANALIKNEWFTLGFTRYFNNTIKL